MTPRIKQTPSNPYPNSTPKECALMILWIAIAGNWNAPPCWALADPDSVGISESAAIRRRHPEQDLDGIVNRLASGQNWRPLDGVKMEKVEGMTMGQVLRHYFN